MNTGQEKFAQTEPFDEINDVDKLGKHAGLETPDSEELGLKEKLEQRDEERLDIDSPNNPKANN